MTLSDSTPKLAAQAMWSTTLATIMAADAVVLTAAATEEKEQP